MKTCRLIYRSRSSWETLSNEMLRELATQSAARNAEKGITGILLLSDETFLQVLEGPADAVNTLYARIVQDRRHHGVTLLDYEQTPCLLFKDWGMNVLDLFDIPALHRGFLRSKYEEKEGFIVIPDDPRLALALLLDARAICSAAPMS